MCRHRVQFYDSDAFLARKVLAFLAPGVREGGSAVVIATPRHLRQFEAMVAEDDCDLGRSERSRFVWLDAHETLARFMDGSFPDAARFRSTVGEVLRRAADLGTGHVGAFGEMVAVLYEKGHPEAAARLEALWETLFAEHRFALLCAYPMSVFSDERHSRAFRAICEAHSAVGPIEQIEPIGEDPEGLYRVIAQLQQQANAAAAARVRQETDDAAASASGVQSGNPAAPLLTLENAALELGLSLPHVLKLVSEQRFNDVVRPAGRMPLIPRYEVDRVARELGSPLSG